MNYGRIHLDGPLLKPNGCPGNVSTATTGIAPEKGIYLPLDLWKRADQAGRFKGPGGQCTDFNQDMGRRINNSEFVNLVSGSWAGTSIEQSAILARTIRGVLSSGKTVTFAFKHVPAHSCLASTGGSGMTCSRQRTVCTVSSRTCMTSGMARTMVVRARRERLARRRFEDRLFMRLWLCARVSLRSVFDTELRITRNRRGLTLPASHTLDLKRNR